MNHKLFFFKCECVCVCGGGGRNRWGGAGTEVLFTNCELFPVIFYFRIPYSA